MDAEAQKNAADFSKKYIAEELTEAVLKKQKQMDAEAQTKLINGLEWPFTGNILGNSKKQILQKEALETMEKDKHKYHDDAESVYSDSEGEEEFADKNEIEHTFENQKNPDLKIELPDFWKEKFFLKSENNNPEWMKKYFNYTDKIKPIINLSKSESNSNPLMIEPEKKNGSDVILNNQSDAGKMEEAKIN